jgi:hypothetical protein
MQGEARSGLGHLYFCVPEALTGPGSLAIQLTI